MEKSEQINKNPSKSDQGGKKAKHKLPKSEINNEILLLRLHNFKM